MPGDQEGSPVQQETVTETSVDAGKPEVEVKEIPFRYRLGEKVLFTSILTMGMCGPSMQKDASDAGDALKHVPTLLLGQFGTTKQNSPRSVIFVPTLLSGKRPGKSWGKKPVSRSVQFMP